MEATGYAVQVLTAEANHVEKVTEKQHAWRVTKHETFIAACRDDTLDARRMVSACHAMRFEIEVEFDRLRASHDELRLQIARMRAAMHCLRSNWDCL